MSRAVVEALEGRRLLSFSAQVSFGPGTGAEALPSGWVSDTGLTYQSQNGLTYG